MTEQLDVVRLSKHAKILVVGAAIGLVILRQRHDGGSIAGRKAGCRSKAEERHGKRAGMKARGAAAPASETAQA